MLQTILLNTHVSTSVVKLKVIYNTNSHIHISIHIKAQRVGFRMS